MPARTAAAVLAVALVAALGLAGCSPPSPAETAGPRALTEEEAQLLAVVRLNNLKEGTRTVQIYVPDEGTIDGYADFVNHLGYGLLLDPAATTTGLVSWNLSSVAFRDGGPLPAPPIPPAPIPPPTGGWQVTALDPSTSQMAATLAVVLSLADDRAENYLLLQQEGAQYLRDDTIDGVDVLVLRGPGSANGAVLDYWVDASGLLLRVDIDFRSGDPAIILFTDAEGIQVPPLPLS